MKISFFAAALALCGFVTATAQTLPLRCTPAGFQQVVRSEGFAERLGDIALNCAGGSPGTASAVITVLLPFNVTNKISAGNRADAVLSVDTGSGALQTGSATAGANSVTFTDVTIPVPASGNVTMRISNLRGAVNQLGLNGTLPITATLTASGVTLTENRVTVGWAVRGLLAGLGQGGINCAGSPLPSSASFSNLLAAGTVFGSVRVTEGFQAAFVKKGNQDDTGTRILVRYSGVPAAARVFVPDAIAGSSALQPTAAGDLGLTPSGGRYAPSAAGSLLLVRVLNADANGAGGTLALNPATLGPGPVSLDSVSELAATNGAAVAVYGVVDAQESREHAQIPLFVGLESPGITGSIDASVRLGPLSSDATASADAPVPRFGDAEPPSDCSVSGDCAVTSQ